MRWRIGQKVVSLSDFNEVRFWGFHYPHKGQVVTITGIAKHPFHNFYLLTIDTCEVELCERNFAPIEPMAVKKELMVEIEQYITAQ